MHEEDQHPPGCLRFGIFEVDLGSGELHKHGLRVRLQEQPFQVLAMLLEHPGEVVSREELQKRLWPAETNVDFDHGLNKAVNKIRDALGDSAESPRFVETVARRGYRFLAEVKAVDGGGSPSVPGRPKVPPSGPVAEVAAHPGKVAKSKHVSRWLLAAVAVVGLVAILAIWMIRARNPPTPVIHSLGVLPLESLSGDATQDYFADGMTDELITNLGKISALRVISRTSVMPYKGVRRPLSQIARELGVDTVVEGTVLRSGNRVRITAQLIEASADKHLWAQSYEGDLGDTLALQNHVARAIAEEIRITLSSQEEVALKSARAVDPEAYVLYLKGRYFWNKRTRESLTKAIEYFHEAIDKDPTYAQAYAGLADSYDLLGNSDFAVLSPQEAYPKAKAAAIRALELDNSLGEAHTSLAFCLGNFEWQWDAAEKEYQKALAFNPGYATAHQWYAMQLSLLGRFDESIVEMRKAESLDPLSLIISADLADVLSAARRYDESIEQSRKAIDIDPNFAIAHFELGQALSQKGMYNEAIAELQKANQLSGEDTTCVAVLAYAYAASGRSDEAQRLLKELKAKPNHRFSFAAHEALIYAGLHANEQAMAMLQKAYQDHFDVMLLRSPAFDPLRSEPEFRNMMQRIGLSR